MSARERRTRVRAAARAWTHRNYDTYTRIYYIAYVFVSIYESQSRTRSLPTVRSAPRHVLSGTYAVGRPGGRLAGHTPDMIPRQKKKPNHKKEARKTGVNYQSAFCRYRPSGQTWLRWVSSTGRKRCQVSRAGMVSRCHTSVSPARRRSRFNTTAVLSAGASMSAGRSGSRSEPSAWNRRGYTGHSRRCRLTMPGPHSSGPVAREG